MLRQSKRERVMAAVEGRESDRIPVSFWYHFPLDHPSGEPLAEVELAFAKKYDPDFLKIMHDLRYELPDGMTTIEDPKDWRRLKPLSVKESNFTEQIKALKLIRKGLTQDMPIIDTVFGPFATANKLCGKKLVEHLMADPQSVRQGLQAIAVTLADYAQWWIEEGGDGIYFALDGAQKSVTSEELYKDIFLPLDRLIMETAMDQGTFNVLHLHGSDIMFNLTHDLPNHLLNWSSQTTKPSLSEARGIHSGCISGGIDEFAILGKSPLEVMDEARRAVAEAGSVGFILTPGCAVPTDIPEENLFALRQIVEP